MFIYLCKSWHTDQSLLLKNQHTKIGMYLCTCDEQLWQLDFEVTVFCVLNGIFVTCILYYFVCYSFMITIYNANLPISVLKLDCSVFPFWWIFCLFCIRKIVKYEFVCDISAVHVMFSHRNSMAKKLWQSSPFHEAYFLVCGTMAYMEDYATL